MGQVDVYRSEPRGAAAICREAAMREREANAPGFTHESDSYCDLFGAVHSTEVALTITDWTSRITKAMRGLLGYA
jgi:hypothetical protein